MGQAILPATGFQAGLGRAGTNAGCRQIACPTTMPGRETDRAPPPSEPPAPKAIPLHKAVHQLNSHRQATFILIERDHHRRQPQQIHWRGRHHGLEQSNGLYGVSKRRCRCLNAAIPHGGIRITGNCSISRSNRARILSRTAKFCRICFAVGSGSASACCMNSVPVQCA